jgi:hypothetical protein
MVIEYTGNVIRSVLTDKREKYYESRVRICMTKLCNVTSAMTVLNKTIVLLQINANLFDFGIF